MKNQLFLLTVLIVFPTLAFGQYEEPPVEWKIFDSSTKSPNNAIMVPNSSLQDFQPGVNLILPNDQFPTRRTGEDWWYSVAVDPITGGYFAAGYSTWMYFDRNENFAGGCKIDAATQGDPLERPYFTRRELIT